MSRSVPWWWRGTGLASPTACSPRNSSRPASRSSMLSGPRSMMVEGKSMHADIEAAARASLARVLDPGVGPGDIDPDIDMADGYGLTSLNKVLFLMSACDE